MDHLASLLFTYRKQARLTQKQLGELMNFNHTVISRAENPASNYLPTRAYIEKYCQTLQLDQEDVQEILAAYQEAHLARQKPGHVDNDKPDDPFSEQAQPMPLPGTHKPGGDRRWHLNMWIVILLTCLVLAAVVIFLPKVKTYASKPVVKNPGERLFSESFETHSVSEWESLNTGKWEVFDRDGSAVFGVIQPDPEAVPNAFLSQSLGWSDYSVQFDTKFQSGEFEQIYIAARNAGRENNCTGYRIGGNRLGVSIFRFDYQGTCLGEVLAETNRVTLQEGTLYHMRVDVAGPQILYFIDDNLILETEDSTYLSGGVGLLAYQVDWAYFDNIVVVQK